MNLPKCACALLVAGAVASPAAGYANLEGEMYFNPAGLDGYVANELIWTGETDWTSAALVVDLTTGSVYHDAFGGDGPYTPALLVPFPSVEFDTYVGIVSGEGNGIAGPAGDLGVGILSLDAPLISVSWFNTGTNDIGPVRIGMITLSNDAHGTWSFLSAGQVSTGMVYDGMMFFPEPASLALLSLGGLALLRRR